MLPATGNLALYSPSLFEPASPPYLQDLCWDDLTRPLLQLRPIQIRVRLEEHLRELHPDHPDFYAEGCAGKQVIFQIRDYHQLPLNGLAQRILHDLVGQRNGDYFYRFVAPPVRMAHLFPTLTAGEHNLEHYRDYLSIL